MIELIRECTFTVKMDEAYARKVYAALRETLHTLDTTSHKYVELVNKGHVDTLCVLRNMFTEDFS